MTLYPNHMPPHLEGTEAASITLPTRQRLRVRTLGYNGLRCGQVFWDQYEEVLEYHVVPYDRYSSYIEAPGFRVDVDGAGAPVFVELDLGLSVCKPLIASELPDIDLVCRHRFLDFPAQIRRPRVFVSVLSGIYHIVFSRLRPISRWAFAPGAIWEVDEGSCAVGLWLYDAICDPSGCRRAAWRRGVWQAYRRGRTEELANLTSHPERGWLSLPKIFP